MLADHNESHILVSIFCIVNHFQEKRLLSVLYEAEVILD
jgi:hypothetical protein